MRSREGVLNALEIEMTRERQGSGLLLKAVIAVIGVEIFGFLGSLFMSERPDPWYQALHKPAFTPPDAAFGIIWPILFLLIGIAAALVWERGGTAVIDRRIWVSFYVQLAINFSFTPIFFGLRAPLGGALVTTVLLPVVLWNILAFRTVSRAAGALLIPYLAWGAFAAVLAWSIVAMNR